MPKSNKKISGNIYSAIAFLPIIIVLLLYTYINLTFVEFFKTVLIAIALFLWISYWTSKTFKEETKDIKSKKTWKNKMTEIKKLKIAGAIISSIGLIVSIENKLIGYILIGIGSIVASLDILKIIKW